MTTDNPTQQPATPSARNWRRPEYRRSEAMRQAAERTASARQGASLLGREIDKEKEE